MKKIVKFSLTLLAACVISACGSSGGGNNSTSPAANNNTNTSVNKPAPTQTTPTQPTQTNSSDDMGTAFRTRDSKEFEINTANTYKQVLVVDGKTFPVAWSGIVSGGFTKIPKNATINGVTYNDVTVSGTKYASSKFGHIDGYVFTQGEETPKANMPKTGTATYNVEGVFVANGQDSLDSKGHTLTVDFANKTINGDVAPNVTITNAKIDDNEFEGTAVYNGKAAELEGHFYGPDASEIGGAYSSSSFSGAFGGKKQ
ncbi:MULTISPECIES: Slam-dependent surface lipoprotein [unclassified Mannheimia]|uniref:Slam-dependent surface lipoprotein n=1 Tax=unclassified Mannheimia TaxID=2645054 RepID=UPI00359D8D96